MTKDWLDKGVWVEGDPRGLGASSAVHMVEGSREGRRISCPYAYEYRQDTNDPQSIQLDTTTRFHDVQVIMFMIYAIVLNKYWHYD